MTAAVYFNPDSVVKSGSIPSPKHMYKFTSEDGIQFFKKCSNGSKVNKVIRFIKVFNGITLIKRIKWYQKCKSVQSVDSVHVHNIYSFHIIHIALIHEERDEEVKVPEQLECTCLVWKLQDLANT